MMTSNNVNNQNYELTSNDFNNPNMNMKSAIENQWNLEGSQISLVDNKLKSTIQNRTKWTNKQIKNESKNISVHEESTSTGGMKNNVQDFKKKFTNDNSNNI